MKIKTKVKAGPRDCGGGGSKLPGYPAEFESLKPGQFVEIYMAKTKTPIRTKGKGIKLDDDDDPRMRPEVVMIVILQEAPKQ